MWWAYCLKNPGKGGIRPLSYNPHFPNLDPGGARCSELRKRTRMERMRDIEQNSPFPSAGPEGPESALILGRGKVLNYIRRFKFAIRAFLHMNVWLKNLNENILTSEWDRVNMASWGLARCDSLQLKSRIETRKQNTIHQQPRHAKDQKLERWVTFWESNHLSGLFFQSNYWQPFFYSRISVPAWTMMRLTKMKPLVWGQSAKQGQHWKSDQVCWTPNSAFFSCY